MEDIRVLLGKRIKELRKKRNITQQQLAELIDIDQRNLSAIECGINFPTKSFMKIADAFNIKLQELFDFEHLELSNENIKIEIKNMVDKLDPHDLKIIYRFLKSMN